MFSGKFGKSSKRPGVAGLGGEGDRNRQRGHFVYTIRSKTGSVQFFREKGIRITLLLHKVSQSRAAFNLSRVKGVFASLSNETIQSAQISYDNDWTQK